MALFDVFKKGKEKQRFNAQTKKKDIPKTAEPEVKVKKNKALTKASNFVAGEILKPRVTEKATLLGEKGIYVFEIASDVNSTMVKREIKRKYNVDVVKVNIINLPAKNVVIRGRRGTKSGIKKAVVYLKKGDKITVE